MLTEAVVVELLIESARISLCQPEGVEYKKRRGSRLVSSLGNLERTLQKNSSFNE